MSRIVGADAEYEFISNEEDLISFCEFDEDLNGNNGSEYTIQEALDGGFKNSAHYIVSKAKEEVGAEDFSKLIETALAKVCNTDETYLNHKVIELGNGNYLGMIIVAKSC